MPDLESDLRAQLAREAENVQSVPRDLWLRVVDGAGGARGRWVRAVPALVAVLFIATAAVLLSRAQQVPPAGSAAGTTHSPTPTSSAHPKPTVAVTATSTPAASAFSCGTAPAGGTKGRSADLTAVRVAHQPGFDRVVFEFAGGVPEYKLTQQSGTRFTEDASGKNVDLQGVAGLKIVFRGASGQGTYSGSTDIKLDPAGPGGNPGDSPAVAETREIGDFERVLSWGMGINTKPGCLRVSELAAPSRLVIDVQDKPRS